MKWKRKVDRGFYRPQLILAAAVFLFLCGSIIFFLGDGDAVLQQVGTASTSCVQIQRASGGALTAVDRAIEAIRDNDFGLTEKYLRDAHRKLSPVLKPEQNRRAGAGRGEKNE